MSAAIDSRVWWWVTRASGIVAWVVVAAAVVWGLLASTKLIRKRGVPAWILDLHRYLGTLTIVFVIVHVGAIWLDSFVKFTPMQLAVPFASSWRPHAVAWGIFATYLLVAIQVTSWAMRRLPRKLWHRVHVLSLPMLVLVTVHGFLAGTDRSNRVLQWSAFVVMLGVVFLLVVRMLSPSRPSREGTTTAIREHRRRADSEREMAV
ncbi:MAG TPA: ferric reductase-like transmembrane domain-containing protein [Acidimicrobiia bacterium]